MTQEGRTGARGWWMSMVRSSVCYGGPVVTIFRAAVAIVWSQTFNSIQWLNDVLHKLVITGNSSITDNVPIFSVKLHITVWIILICLFILLHKFIAILSLCLKHLFVSYIYRQLNVFKVNPYYFIVSGIWFTI